MMAKPRVISMISLATSLALILTVTGAGAGGSRDELWTELTASQVSRLSSTNDFNRVLTSPEAYGRSWYHMVLFTTTVDRCPFCPSIEADFKSTAAAFAKMYPEAMSGARTSGRKLLWTIVDADADREWMGVNGVSLVPSVAVLGPQRTVRDVFTPLPDAPEGTRSPWLITFHKRPDQTEFLAEWIANSVLSEATQGVWRGFKITKPFWIRYAGILKMVGWGYVLGALTVTALFPKAVYRAPLKSLATWTVIFVWGFVVAGGFYDIIRTPPLNGRRRGDDGNAVATWINSQGTNQQFVGEGAIAMFLELALALIFLTVGVLVPKLKSGKAQGLVVVLCLYGGYVALSALVNMLGSKMGAYPFTFGPRLVQ